jgi:hypothetical protein
VNPWSALVLVSTADGRLEGKFGLRVEDQVLAHDLGVDCERMDDLSSLRCENLRPDLSIRNLPWALTSCRALCESVWSYSQFLGSVRAVDRERKNEPGGGMSSGAASSGCYKEAHHASGRTSAAHLRSPVPPRRNLITASNILHNGQLQWARKKTDSALSMYAASLIPEDSEPPLDVITR